jgi:hypothetical protein
VQWRQVDLVPTICALLGLPIPRNNVGRIITPALAKLQPNADLRVMGMRHNARQLAKLYAQRHHIQESQWSSDPTLQMYRSVVDHVRKTRQQSNCATQKTCDIVLIYLYVLDLFFFFFSFGFRLITKQNRYLSRSWTM